ncbi:hypothetical protein [Streptomyces hydrogenans]
MFAKWWEQYGRQTAQGKASVRSAITAAIDNGIEPNLLWQALVRVGDLSKPITGGTLQFALAELKRHHSPNADVIDLAAARRPSTTDQRVNAALELGRRMQAAHDAKTRENQ